MRPARYRSWLRAWAAGSLLAALASTPAAAATLQVGDRLEQIMLVDRGGAKVTFDSLPGKIVIVDFWAHWCAPCRPALHALDELARRYAADGLVVLGVSADGNRDAAEAFLSERFPTSAVRFVYDPGQRLLARVGASGFPALYLLDRQRIVRFAGSGWSPSETAALEQEIARLLGRPRQSQSLK